MGTVYVHDWISDVLHGVSKKNGSTLYTVPPCMTLPTCLSPLAASEMTDKDFLIRTRRSISKIESNGKSSNL